MNKLITIMALFGILLFGHTVSACEIGNVVVTQLPCSNTGNFAVQIDFEYADGGPNGFWVTGGGWNHGNFLYQNLPITIDGLPGDGSSFWEFVVTDVANEACSNYALLGVVDCTPNEPCSIYDLAASASCEGANAFAGYTFGFANNTTDNYAIYANTTQLAVVPFAQQGEWVAIPSEFQGQTINFTVIEENNSPCNDVISIEVPNCTVGAVCSITNVVASTTECVNGQYYVDISFAATNTSGSYLIYGGGVTYGTFSPNTSNNAIHIGPLSPNNTNQLEFVVADAQNTLCHSVAIGVVTPSCTTTTECHIYDLTATASCDGEAAYINYNFLHSGTTNSYYELYINDHYLTYIPFNQQGEWIQVPADFEGQTVNFYVSENDNFACHDVVSVAIPSCPTSTGDCSITNVVATATDCVDGQFYVHLSFSAINTSGTYTVFGNGATYGTYTMNSNSNVIEIGPIAATSAAQLEFIIEDAQNEACHNYDLLPMPVCGTNTECHIYDLTATASCDGNAAYINYNFLHSGTTNSYYELYINDHYLTYIPFNQQGEWIQVPADFEGQTVNFYVSENDNFTCHDVVSVAIPNCPTSTGDCSITNVIATTTECVDGQFYVDVTFSAANTTGVYLLYGGGITYGTFAINNTSNTIHIGPLTPNDMNQIELVVADAQNTACHSTGILVETPSCGNTTECHIYDLTATASCDGNAAYINYNFLHSGTTNSFYELYINDHYLTYIPFNQQGEWIQVPADFEGQTVNFYVSENDNFACHDVVSVAIPNCPTSTGDCSITNVIATTTECVDGQFYVDVTFSAANTSGVYLLYGGGITYGTFAINNTSNTIHIGPLTPNDMNQIELVVADAQNTACHSTGILVETPSCGNTTECHIYDLTATASCDGNAAYINYNFLHSGTTNSFYELYINDHYLTYIPFNQQGEWIQVPADFEGQTVNFYVSENDNFACHDVVSVAIPNCPTSTTNCSITNVVAMPTECVNGQFYVNINFAAANTTGTVNIFGNGANYGFFNTNELPIQLGPFSSNNTGVMEFIIQDSQMQDCISDVVVNIPQCTTNNSCHIYDLWAEADCNMETGLVTLHYGFFHSNVTGDSFHILINNETYGTDNFAGQNETYSILLGNDMEGSTIILRITDSSLESCYDVVEVAIPACEVNTTDSCWISGVEYETTECVDGLYSIVVNFVYGNNPENSEGFVIHGGGAGFNTIYGTFGYNELPVTIGPFEASSSPLNFGISDLGVDGCDSDNFSVQPPTCATIGDCSITGLSVNLVCDGDNAYINYSFNHSNTPSTSFNISVNGNVIGSHNYEEPGFIYHQLLPANLQGIGMMISISDFESPNCAAFVQTVSPDCTPTNNCDIAELVASASECVDGQFTVTLNFAHENTSDQFTVTGAGMSYGSFPYSQLPITLGPFSANNTGFMTFIVNDLNSSNCGAVVTVANPNCNTTNECAIYGISTEINCDGNSAYLHFNLSTSGLTGSGFVASINGVNLGNFAYGLNSYTLNLGNQYAGQLVELTLTDNQFEGCNSTINLQVPSCSTEPLCSITGLTATASDCENGLFNVSINFDHSNTGTLFHLTSGNGINYGVYNYEDLPIIVGPLEGDGLTNYGFEVSDFTHPGCGDFVEIEAVTCGEPAGCNIYNLTAQTFCEGELAHIVYSFNYTGTVGENFNYYLNGTFMGEAAFGQSTYEITVPATSWSNTVLSIQAQLNGYVCGAELAITLPNCNQINECSIFDVSATPLECNNDGNYYIELNFEYINTSTQFTVTNGLNATYGTFYYPALPIILGPFVGDGNTAHVFEIVDSVEDGCAASISVAAVSCTVPTCNISAISYDNSGCDASGNFSTQVFLDVENNSSTGFNLYLEGELYGSYPYSALPISIEGLGGDGLTIYNVLVQDLTDENCTASLEIPAVDCQWSDCIITNLNADVTDCNDGVFHISVDFAAANVGMNGFTISSNQGIGGTYSYMDLPIELTWLESTNSSLTLTVTDNGNSNCSETITIDGLVCGSAVWPGDANNDGVANNFDVLDLGLVYGFEGVARANASLNWEGQWCLDWDGNFLNNANYKHADCNGNGVVSESDIQAIDLNYGQVHGKGEAEADEEEAPLFVDIPEGNIPAGTLFEAPIVFGTVETPGENVYGIAFTINYDPTIFEDNTQIISFENSWLGHFNSQIKTLVKHFPEENKFEIALTRITHSNVAMGYGEIGTLRAILVENVEGKTNYDVQFIISNVRIISYDESNVPFSLPVEIGTVNSSAVESINSIDGMIVYPNPTADFVIIDSNSSNEMTINLWSVDGKMLLSERIQSNKHILDVRGLAQGIYFLEQVNEFGIKKTKLYISR